jgi:2-polyprenyl-6-methoxyphenol hydroxylase-like FAD-dependent oxidoreductase
MSKRYDVIVVGARCAGSPTAMLLARRGYRVLLVDRATFPSDTLSTHIVLPCGISSLARWGILERLAATGCPPIHTISYDFGPLTIEGTPGWDESPVAYCPRRTVLDKLLVDAAVEAGAELREGFLVEELATEDGRVVGVEGRTRGGAAVRERATVVVGADGWHSLVAESVRAERYRETPPLSAAYFAYWSDLPVGDRVEIHIRPYRGFGAAPTHDGLTMVIGGWPHAEFEANRHDVEGTFLRMLENVPDFAARLRGARRVTRFAGAAIPNYFRKPYGPGWALVGDAGYIRDSITAQGITDAFRDAERCAGAIDESLRGVRPFEEAMSDYQRDRDERVAAMYEITCQFATLAPPPPEMARLLGAVAASREASDAFVRMNAGTIPPEAFYSMEQVRAGMAAPPAAIA